MSTIDYVEHQLAKAAKYKRQRDQLHSALIEAMLTIKALHGPAAWDIYERNAPEMKRIRAAMDAVDE